MNEQIRTIYLTFLHLELEFVIQNENIYFTHHWPTEEPTYFSLELHRAIDDKFLIDLICKRHLRKI